MTGGVNEGQAPDDLPPYARRDADGVIWSQDGSWRWTGAEWARVPDIRAAQRRVLQDAAAKARRRQENQGLGFVGVAAGIVALAIWGVTSWASGPDLSPEECTALSLSTVSGDTDSAVQYSEHC